MSDADALERLQNRLERERRARRKAEVIAERGMRELWDANRELRERVASRTANLERLVSALEFAQRERLKAIADTTGDVVRLCASAAAGPPEFVAAVTSRLTELRLLTESGRPSDGAPETDCEPVEILDRLMERWQRFVARHGQLLSVEDASTVSGLRHWPQVMAVADTLIGGVSRYGGAGSVSVRLSAGPDDTRVDVTGVGLAPALGAGRDGPVPMRADLALAERIAATASGTVTIRRDAAAPGIVVRLPSLG